MMSRYKPIGWRNESYRHSLASKGISSSMRKKSFLVVNAPENIRGDAIIIDNKVPVGKVDVLVEDEKRNKDIYAIPEVREQISGELAENTKDIDLSDKVVLDNKEQLPLQDYVDKTLKPIDIYTLQSAKEEADEKFKMQQEEEARLLKEAEQVNTQYDAEHPKMGIKDYVAGFFKKPEYADINKFKVNEEVSQALKNSSKASSFNKEMDKEEIKEKINDFIKSPKTDDFKEAVKKAEEDKMYPELKISKSGKFNIEDNSLKSREKIDKAFIPIRDNTILDKQQPETRDYVAGKIRRIGERVGFLPSKVTSQEVSNEELKAIRTSPVEVWGNKSIAKLAMKSSNDLEKFNRQMKEHQDKERLKRVGVEL